MYHIFFILIFFDLTIYIFHLTTIIHALVNAEKDNIENNLREYRLEIKNQETNLTDSGDIAEQEIEITKINQRIDRQKLRLEKINLAMYKIQNNVNYGECNECGYDIPTGRLEAIPEAEYCTECLVALEREKAQYA